MNIRFYNSLTNKVEEFKPIKEKEVSIYVCGPTVYNDPHIGNMRPVVFFDTFRKFLEEVGYHVKYVSNYTDVDDKIIKKAIEEKKSEKEITTFFINEYEKCLSALNVAKAYENPKVTEYMPSIISYINGLVEKGAAYVNDGEVFFDVTKDKKVYVNDKPIDLAHTYFKQDNKYINLGIASGCIEDGQYGISAQLDNLTEFHHAKAPNKEQAKQEAQAIFDVCVTKIKNDKSQTTQDMIERNIKINNCLAEAIKQEIQKGFNEKQQAQMLTYFEQTRKGIWNFYNDIYASNKYCYGQCGSITSLLPYSDEGLMLMQMLERLLYLNIAKNGY